MPALIRFSSEHGYTEAKIYRQLNTGKAFIVADVRHVDTRSHPYHTQTFKIVANLREIYREVQAAFSNSVGWNWKDIKKAANGVTKKVGLSRIVGVIKKVSEDAATYGSAIYPPLGVTYNAIKQAGRLLKQAENGVVSAKRQIEGIRNLAEKGNKAAIGAARVLLVLNSARKHIDLTQLANTASKHHGDISLDAVRHVVNRSLSRHEGSLSKGGRSFWSYYNENKPDYYKLGLMRRG